jgi:hypothetical protein
VSRAPLWILILVVLALGLYSSWLNHEFYLSHSPFFDSAAYTNYLARVYGSTRIDSVKDGLDVALDASTAPLPGLETLVLALARVPIPSFRQLGVWLQVIWLIPLALSLYFYWSDERQRGTWASLLLTLPFLCFSAVFFWNGGLMDFRLDLSLYIFLASAAVWYLRTYSTYSRRAWILAGVFVTLASLSRATAPVFWVAMAGPLIALRLVTGSAKQRKELLAGIGWMILPAAVVALPYFLTHFSYLYYYYAQWNIDATAHLSLQTSLTHLYFAFGHVGWALGIAGALFFGAVLWDTRREKRKFDWKLLYIGFAPVLFLVLQRAGLNSYVSIPAVFGWLMFLVAPLTANGPILRSVWSRAAGAALVIACIWNAAMGVGQTGYGTRISAMRQGIEWMRADALRKNLPKVDFVTFHNWNYHPYFIRNVLINEYGFQSSRWSLVSPEGILWEPFHKFTHTEASYEFPFTASVPVVWQEDVQGGTDAQKIDWMYDISMKNIDYVFFPDDATIDFMERYIPHNFINTKVRAIRKRFLDAGTWVEIGTPLAITDSEKVQLYGKK